VNRPAKPLPRVAIDVRYLRRPDVGISVYITSFVRELLERNWPVELLCDSEAQRNELESLFPSSRVVALTRGQGFFWEQITLPAYLKRSRPTLFVAPANWGIPLLYIGPTRLVVVVHDLIPLRMPKAYLLPDLFWSAKYLLSTAIAALRSDWVITNSRATAADVRRLWRRRQLRVVYPGALRDPSVGSAVNGAGDAGGYFLYAGGAGPRKNVRRLLEAMAALRLDGDDRKLVISGSSGKLIESEVEQMGLGDVVKFTGSVKSEALVELVRRSDAVVHPSQMEGFGLPIVDALANGVPVVCGRLPAVQEIAGDLPHYADVNDVSSIAAAMRTAGTVGSRLRVRERAPSHFCALRTRNECAGAVQVLTEIADSGRFMSVRRRALAVRPAESGDGEIRRRSSRAGAES
jgi:glycosyltransferase involved in cell wall biosynthesis